MATWSERVTLGRTGLSVSRLGIGSSYGIREDDLARAFDGGVNLFYWGTLRREGFARGLRPLLARRRDEVVLVAQSYARFGLPLRVSFERALRQLGTDHADVLLLGMWNRPPPPRVWDAAQELVESGRARHVMVSCHRRATFAAHARDEHVGAIMVRYNAAHPGAEEDTFPQLPADPPGVIAYTATCWGWLLDPARVPPGESPLRASDCYRFALSHPAVDACLIGPRNGADLDEALTALPRGPLSADERATVLRVGAGLKRSSLVPWQG